jgi:hypothetical protein
LNVRITLNRFILLNAGLSRMTIFQSSTPHQGFKPCSLLQSVNIILLKGAGKGGDSHLRIIFSLFIAVQMFYLGLLEYACCLTIIDSVFISIS